MTYQLFPPDDHWCNIAEKSIKTWKDHFIGVLSGTAPTFPMHLWCQLISQAYTQLLILVKSQANPKILAYAHLYGPHDYNSMPFLPIGMEALMNWSSPRRPLFLHALSFECISKLCIDFLNQFLVYFHI